MSSVATRTDFIVKGNDLRPSDILDQFPWFGKMTVTNAAVNIIKGQLAFLGGAIISGVWEEGLIYKAIVINATIKNTKWIYGIFKGGSFENGEWLDGTFTGGDFVKSVWKKGIFQNGNFIKSKWVFGSFQNGYAESSQFRKPIVIGGNFKLCDFSGGILENAVCEACDYSGHGEITKSSWRGGRIKGDDRGTFWSNSKFYKGEFNGPWWKDGEWLDGHFKDGIIDDGTFSKGLFTGGEIHGGFFDKVTFDGAEWYYGIAGKNMTWKSGYWKKGRAYTKHGKIMYYPPPWSKDEV